MQTAIVATAAAAGAGLCDLCGTDPHPEHTCLWRRYRALVKAPAGGHHFSDDLHAAIEDGPVPEPEGTEMFRRLLGRAAGHKDALGFTGSVQELEDDVAASRPLTRYR